MQQTRTLGDRLIDACFEQHRCLFINDGSHQIVAVRRVTVAPGTGFGQHQVGEIPCYFFVNKHTLDRGTSLARIFVRTVDGQGGSLLQVGIVHHDKRVVTAKF